MSTQGVWRTLLPLDFLLPKVKEALGRSGSHHDIQIFYFLVRLMEKGKEAQGDGHLTRNKVSPGVAMSEPITAQGLPHLDQADTKPWVATYGSKGGGKPSDLQPLL